MERTIESISVPDDFPRPAPSLVALSGLQPKFAVVRDEDGIYRQPGTTLSDLLSRYQHCLELADWGTQLMLAKSRKPKYSELNEARLLQLFQRTLINRFDLSVAEQLWVRAAAARRLGWIDDASIGVGSS